MAKPRSLPRAKPATPQNRRRKKEQQKKKERRIKEEERKKNKGSNQLGDAAYEALKANVKLTLVATRDGLSAAGTAAKSLGSASRQIGEILKTVSDELTDQLSG